MESRKVKVIDEHGIDRAANVICKFTVDQSDYVLYSIERDNENDNLFVSKLINNNDGTSSMINIEDNAEKSKTNEIIKEMITYSINSEEGTAKSSIMLSNGKNVEISSVLLNKEQNINVAKTYITTVKKAVTKVSEDFYKVDDSKKEDSVSSQIFEAMKDDVFVTPTTHESVVEANLPVNEKTDSVMTEMPQVEPINPTVPITNINKDIEPKVNNIALDVPKVENEKEIIPITNEVIPEIKTSENVEPIKSNSKEEPMLVNNIGTEILPKVENQKESLPVSNVIVPEVKPILEPVVTPIPKVEPILPVQSEEKKDLVVSPEPILPVEPVTNINSSEPKLFFDGSKETNLNMALGEVSEDKTMTTQADGVQALRQFGSDEPVSAPLETLPVQENVKTLTRSKGFANNKFFMVIAIAFFVAACVFLGYEVFQYFQIKG